MITGIPVSFARVRNCDRWSGNPSRMKCRSCWYSTSSWAILRNVFRWGVAWPLFVVALISEIKTCGWSMKPSSASMSLCDGSNTGFLDSASGALLLLPLSHSVVKLYPMSLVHSLYKRRFSISPSLWLFSMRISGLWAVITWKHCNPTKNVWHLMIAHQTASISSSMMA